MAKGGKGRDGILGALLDPARAEGGAAASGAVLALAIAAFAFAYQFVSPRIGDEIPLVGDLRKFSGALFGNGPKLFHFGLFLRGIATGAVLCGVAAAFSLLAPAVRTIPGALGGAAAASSPLLLTSALAVPLYQIKPAFGLLPLLGLLWGAFLLHDRVSRGGFHRTGAAYLAPLVWLVQLYLLYALLP